MTATTTNDESSKKGTRVDLRAELDRFETSLQELKVTYEQYFAGILTLAPDKQHQDIKRLIRQLRKAPFKNSAMNYRLRTLEMRYNTYNTYWQRVLREREEGTYFKDVFKANLRELAAIEDQRAGTAEGAAEKGMRSLFDAYRGALEKNTGSKAHVEFDSFKASLIKRAKDFNNMHPGKKLSFKVVVKNGRVSLQATVRKPGEEK